MRIISLSVIFIGLVLIAVSCKDRAAGKRYGIKKGIVVSESIYSGNRAKSTITMHFDDYGEKEYTIAKSETGVNGVVKISEQQSLLDGEFFYTWDKETKKGSKFKYAEILDPFKLSKEDFTEDMKKQFNFKELGIDTVLGKPCNVVSLSFNGVQGKMFSWKNIILKSEISSQGVQVTTQAISLDESPKFDKELFELPQGNIEFSEFVMPEGPPKKGSPQ